MNIAVIGGSGFVGSKLIDLLVNQHEYGIKNIDKLPSISFPDLSVLGDVLDKDSLTTLLKDIDVVVLLAAEHRDDVTPVAAYYDVNVGGLKNTLEAMKENNVSRLIFASSVAIYGLNKDNPDENFAAEPFNHYGKSKWQAEEVLQEWYKNNPSWNINIIRPTVIFGEGNRGNVFNLLAQIASGKFLMIGKGQNQKSMSYVQNVVAFIEFLMVEKQRGYNVYNYVDKPDFNTNDLVYHTGEILGKRIPSVKVPYWLGILGGYGFDVLAFFTGKKLSISSIRVKKFCAITKYDSTKAMSSGFVPPFSMAEGLRKMLNEEFGK